MVKLLSWTKRIFKWTDRWKCQCLMITDLALWMDKQKILQKSFEILSTIVSFSTLILSIISLNGETQTCIYEPDTSGHFLVNKFLKNHTSQGTLKHDCHYFESLRHVKYVGFNREVFLQIRMIILFVLWIIDMLGLFFSYVHPPCGTKMYVFGSVITLLFFVMFPTELCINFGNDCIEHSPIFHIYTIEFIIRVNAGWIGAGVIGLIVFIYPINYVVKEYWKVCVGSEAVHDIIYGIVCIPFFVIAILNFVTSLWTSMAIVNIMTLISLIINFLLYHSGTDVRKQQIQRQRQVRKTLKNLPKDQEDCNLQFDSNQIGNVIQVQEDESICKPDYSLKKGLFASPQKPDRMCFYRQWQTKLQTEFYET